MSQQFYYSLSEEYLILAVADPEEKPDDIYLGFYWERFHSPLIELTNFVDREVYAVGNFLPVGEAFPDMSVEERIAQWELEYGEEWDESKIFRAFKVQLDVFFAQEYEADHTPRQIADSLEVDYSFGTGPDGLQDMELVSRISCGAGSVDELDNCKEQKSETH